jgi:hypothetical protein
MESYEKKTLKKEERENIISGLIYTPILLFIAWLLYGKFETAFKVVIVLTLIIASISIIPLVHHIIVNRMFPEFFMKREEEKKKRRASEKRTSSDSNYEIRESISYREDDTSEENIGTVHLEQWS